MNGSGLWVARIREAFLVRKDRQLVLVIFAILVTGFVLTSLLSFYVSRNALRSEIDANTLPLTSDNIYSEIQRDVLRPVFISSLMASDTFLRDWVLDGEKDPERVAKYLKEIKVKFNAFTAFFVSDRTLKYYYSDGVLKTVSPGEVRDVWYFRVRKMTENYEINVDPDLANKDAMTIFINYRVFGYDGNYLGATGVGLTIDSVRDLIEDYQHKYDRRIYFIDGKGKVMLSGSGFPKEITNVFQLDGMQEFTELVRTRTETSCVVTRNGEPVHINMRYIPEFQWYLLVEQGEAGATRHIYKTLMANMGISALVTLVVMGLVVGLLKAYQSKLDTLRGIVPICSYCRKVRDDQGYWRQLEAYIATHTAAELSHGICPACMKKHFSEYAHDHGESEKDVHPPPPSGA